MHARGCSWSANEPPPASLPPQSSATSCPFHADTCPPRSAPLDVYRTCHACVTAVAPHHLTRPRHVLTLYYDPPSTHTRPSPSHLFASTSTHRPAKKRCQFRVIYNIPVSPTATDAETTEGAETKPTMTANPTQCPSAALKIAGDCIHCGKVFCSVHRTPESHSCPGMQACRDAAFQANKERLERERTVTSKITQA